MLKEIRARLQFLLDVGLEYLTLARGATSLAGGEAQIRLATQDRVRLVGVLYILDEPSIGLHQRDNQRLIETLVTLRDMGNTLIVVEHDEETIRIADHIVDIGPAPGSTVVGSSPRELLMTSSPNRSRSLATTCRVGAPSRASRRFGIGGSLTGGCDGEQPQGDGRRVPAGDAGGGDRRLREREVVVGQRHPLQGGQIHRLLRRDLPGRHRRLVGVERLDKVIDIDQSPIGRTHAPTPPPIPGSSTMSATCSPRHRGTSPHTWGGSPSTSRGRCEACMGDGTIKIEMHFLPDVYVPCEVCGGRRYNRDTLQILWKGHTIAEILAMSVEEALGFFENQPKIVRILQTIYDVGLGYIRLGQPATTLSGGEAQRIKLASELGRRSTGSTFYILDEPTPGSTSRTSANFSACCSGWSMPATPWSSSSTTSTWSSRPIG